MTAPLSVPAQTLKIPLENPKVHHLVGWSGYGDPKRLEVIRSIAVQRGRDPRILSGNRPKAPTGQTRGRRIHARDRAAGKAGFCLRQYHGT